jgi:DNA-binding SARP family transcriptional activator
VKRWAELICMVTITLLGEQAVVDPNTGRTLTRSARSIALLGLLVAHSGAPQSRSSIAGRFWPDSGETQAMTNLRRELHQLRGWVGDDSLEVTGSHLCWHDRGRHDVDLSAFLAEREQALSADDPHQVVDHGARALEAYAGELLPGLDGEWLEELRDELHAACAHLCDVVSAAASELGRPDLAADALRRRVALDPYDEPAHRRLMELLEESGDRAGAVRVYHRFSGLLERELGVEPDHLTTAVLERLMRTGDRTAGQPRARDHGSPRLVGRDTELDRLRRIWRSAASGRARVALVSGAPGVGKSRLVEELAAEVKPERAVVALGRCFEGSGRLPLAPIADWLRSPDVAASRPHVEPLWRTQAERLVPSSGAARIEPPHASDAWQQHRFLEGLARAVLAPERPMLLVLDNLQWCDADTLRVITSLLTVCPEAPVLVVVIARPLQDTSGSAPKTWLADLRRADLLTEVSLVPFDAGETATLAAELTGDARRSVTSVPLLQEATGGFPLLIVEALRAGGSPRPHGDAAWSNILARRLDQLSPTARDIAALASALNRDFTLPVLIHASDLDEDVIVRAVDELWRQRLVRETTEGYDFAHDLIRAAAYDKISPPRRWLLHRRLADALQDTHPAARELIAPQVAEQHALAGDHGPAVTWYLAASDAALGVFALEEILDLMERALAQVTGLPRGRARDERELECRIRQVRTMISLLGYADADVEATSLRIIDLAADLGRVDAETNATSVLFGCLFVRGRMDLALEVARRGIALVDGGPRDAANGSAHLAFGGAALHHGQCEIAYDSFALGDTTAMGEALMSFHARLDVFVPAWWAHAAWARGRPDQAADLAAAAVERASTAAHVPSRVVALTYGALTGQLLGDRAACARRSGEAVRLCDRYTITYYGLYARVLQGWCRGPEGAHELRDAICGLRAHGALGRMPYWLALLADVVRDRAEVTALLDEAVSMTEAGHEHLWLPELWRRQSALLDDDHARALLTQAHGLAVTQGNVALAERVTHDLAARAP